MIINMKLNNDPFNKIKNGSKTIELRLNDEKRSKLKVNDFIEFTNVETNEKMLTEIMELYKYDSFAKLYENFDKVSLGYSENDIANPNDMLEYYPKKLQDKYGVLGIKIKVKK